MKNKYNPATAIIGITMKGSSDRTYACGNCFNEVDRKDNFCSGCGKKFVTDIDGCCSKVVWSFSDLKKEIGVSS